MIALDALEQPLDLSLDGVIDAHGDAGATGLRHQLAVCSMVSGRP